MNDNKQPKATLSRIQARALPILLSSRSIADGCRKAGISRDRFYDWLKQDDFREAFDTGSREIAQEGIRSLKLHANDAVTVLSRLLKARSESVRLKASLAVLDALTKFIEFEQVELRLTEIEKIIAQEGGEFK